MHDRVGEGSNLNIVLGGGLRKYLGGGKWERKEAALL